MFLEDCDNFRDYFNSIVNQVYSEEMTKDEALSLLENKYNYKKNDIEESYRRMYPDGIFKDCFNNFVLELHAISDTSDYITSSKAVLKYSNFINNIIEHDLKQRQLNNQCDTKEIRKEIEATINKEGGDILDLFNMSRDNTITRVDCVKLIERAVSSQPIIRQDVQKIEQSLEQTKEEKSNNALKNIIPTVIMDICEDCPHIIVNERGKPVIKDSMLKFVSWLLQKGFINNFRNTKKQAEITPLFIFNHFETRCKLETIEKAFRMIQPKDNNG